MPFFTSTSKPISIFIWLCLCLWTILLPAIQAQSISTYFINPPSGSANSNNNADPIEYTLGEIQQIAWKTTTPSELGTFNISLWQRRDNNEDDNEGDITGGNIFSKTTPTTPITTITTTTTNNNNNHPITNFTWVVQTYGLDLSISRTFYLSLETNNGTFTSGEFTITQSSSPSSSPTTEPTADPNSETDPDTDTETDTEESTSLTSTGKIALGLGVGIGFPLLSLLAILAYLQYRSARRYAGQPPAHSHSHSHTTHLSPHPSIMGQGQPYAAQAMGMSMAVSPGEPAPGPGPGPGALYRNINLGPSELPPKARPPVYMPPWEVHGASLTGAGEEGRRGTVRGSRGAGGIPELPGEDFI
ncbi:hypothetical protein BJX61DRAFT_543287 [Aspergillus egyptiacus]|nr:hypothetical protein BJX61DRAFT_543287 [Aspergillus egyptiacus]